MMLYVCDDDRNLVCLPYSKQNLWRMAQALGLAKATGDRHVIPEGRWSEIRRKCLRVKARDVADVINGLLHGINFPVTNPDNPVTDLASLARLNNLNPAGLNLRRQRGWSLAEALLIPGIERLPFANRSAPPPAQIAAMARDAGLPLKLVRERLRNGESLERALARPHSNAGAHGKQWQARLAEKQEGEWTTGHTTSVKITEPAQPSPALVGTGAGVVHPVRTGAQ